MLKGNVHNCLALACIISTTLMFCVGFEWNPYLWATLAFGSIASSTGLNIMTFREMRKDE